MGIDLQKYEGYNYQTNPNISVEFSTIAGRLLFIFYL